MLLVINSAFGGFEVPEHIAKKIGCSTSDNTREIRTNPELIAWVKEQPEETRELDIAEIPDDATDWMMIEYDGSETVYACVNGHIVTC